MARSVMVARAPKDPGITEWPGPNATPAEARKAAEALEAAARAKGTFIPSWAVELSSQLGWKSTQLAGMTDRELELLRDVVRAPEVIVGRSTNVTGRGMLVLDEWLAARGIQWSQRWQDVYNKSLYLRTSSGVPVKIMAGAGYSAAEALAAEEGAALAGIRNVPFWPDTAPPASAGGSVAGAGRPPAKLGGGPLGRGGRALRLGIGFGLQALLFAFFWWAGKKHAEEETKNRTKLIEERLDPAVAQALYDQSATIDSRTAGTPTKRLYATVECDVDFSWTESGIAGHPSGESMTDVRFVQMTFSDGDVRGDRETSIERSGVLFSQTKDVRQTRRITFSLLVFDPSYEAYKAEYIKSWDELTAKNPRWRVKPVTGESAEQMHRTKWIHEVSAIEEWRRTKDGKRMLEQIEQARRRPKKPSNATVIR